MDAESLFLNRCKQLSEKINSGNEIDMLDSSAILRQLLIDGTPVLHQANLKYKLKPEFTVCDFSVQPDEFTVNLSLEDGLDPDTRRPGAPRKAVGLDGFLSHPVVYLKGKPHSVRDIIKHCAEVLGGVHLTNNPKERQKLLANYSAEFSIGGLPGATRQMAAVGRVALKGFAPLINAIESSRS